MSQKTSCFFLFSVFKQHKAEVIFIGMYACHLPTIFESVPHKQNYKQISFWQQRIFWPILLPAECLESLKLMATNAREKEIKEPFISIERDLFPLAFLYFLSALVEKTFKNVYKHQDFPCPFILPSLGVYKLWDSAKGWRWPFKRNLLFCINHLVQQKSKRISIYFLKLWSAVTQWKDKSYSAQLGQLGFFEIHVQLSAHSVQMCHLVWGRKGCSGHDGFIYWTDSFLSCMM